MSSDTPTLPELIRTVRDQHHDEEAPTARDRAMAGRLGVARATVTRWCSGTRTPDSVALRRLADEYGLDRWDLLRMLEAHSRGAA